MSGKDNERKDRAAGNFQSQSIKKLSSPKTTPVAHKRKRDDNDENVKNFAAPLPPHPWTAETAPLSDDSKISSRASCSISSPTPYSDILRTSTRKRSSRKKKCIENDNLSGKLTRTKLFSTEEMDNSDSASFKSQSLSHEKYHEPCESQASNETKAILTARIEDESSLKSSASNMPMAKAVAKYRGNVGKSQKRKARKWVPSLSNFGFDVSAINSNIDQSLKATAGGEDLSNSSLSIRRQEVSNSLPGNTMVTVGEHEKLNLRRLDQDKFQFNASLMGIPLENDTVKSQVVETKSANIENDEENEMKRKS